MLENLALESCSKLRYLLQHQAFLDSFVNGIGIVIQLQIPFWRTGLYHLDVFICHFWFSIVFELHLVNGNSYILFIYFDFDILLFAFDNVFFVLPLPSYLFILPSFVGDIIFFGNTAFCSFTGTRSLSIGCLFTVLLTTWF